MSLASNMYANGPSKETNHEELIYLLFALIFRVSFFFSITMTNESSF